MHGQTVKYVDHSWCNFCCGAKGQIRRKMEWTNRSVFQGI